MKTSIYLPIFEALAHETRFRVFGFIYRSGKVGIRPKEVIKEFGVDSGTLDFHLKKLMSVGLVVLKTGGRRGVYCPNDNIPHELTRLFDSIQVSPDALTGDVNISALSHLGMLH